MRAFELYEQTVKKLGDDLVSQVINKDLRELERIYKQNGHEIRIVGGAVRDLLQGKKPKDIDLASDATPDASLIMLQNAGVKTIETGLQHGTITAVMSGEPYEITTLRIDTETDGRHAKVEYTKDWRQDAERRDLTFNAMSMDFDGRLYDYFGGLSDLKAGVAKFVGDTSARIQEDFLRILRYFRFQGRVASPEFDPETLDSIRENATGLKQISGERIWMEMEKILSGNHLSEILTAMSETGVAKVIGLPLTDIDRAREISKHGAVMVLASQINNNADAKKVVSHWKLSNRDRDLLFFLVKHKEADMSRQQAEHMILDGQSPKFLEMLFVLQGDQANARHIASWQPPAFPVTGQDLIDRGMKPGPEFGKVLKRLQQAWRDSNYKLDKDDLLDQVNGGR